MKALPPWLNLLLFLLPLTVIVSYLVKRSIIRIDLSQQQIPAVAGVAINSLGGATDKLFGGRIGSISAELSASPSAVGAMFVEALKAEADKKIKEVKNFLIELVLERLDYTPVSKVGSDSATVP